MDVRQEYKNIVLKAARFAVSGGAMSIEMEDFLIEHLDNIMDHLSDCDFDYLLRNGKIPIREVQDDEEYEQLFEQLEAGQAKMFKPDLSEFDRQTLERYCNNLSQLTNDYKEREWAL